MTNNKHNHYARNPEIRSLIKAIAFLGYVSLGIMWWILYAFTTVLYGVYKFVEEIVKALRMCLDEIAYVLKRIHQDMSYGEMLLSAVELISLVVLGILALYITAIALVLLPIQ